jgi:serine/threonine protein kinase
MLPSQQELLDVADSICKSEGYSLLEVLGGGAFKQVFLVRLPDASLLALKIIRNPDFSPRTAREVNALRKCNHQSIARLLYVDSHIYQGNTYNFMLEEYLSGGSLGDRLRSNGLLDNQNSHKLGSCMIEVLQHLYGLGLVHRDIKPDNIMYRSDGQTPVLVDFGIVRDLSASSLTQTWAQIGPGTPYFASPEQLNNQKHLIDWRADQFSLAVTISVARFGIHPYQYPNEPYLARDTIERVVNRGPRHNSFYNTIALFSPRCLSKMTEPWPVGRFRLPNDLANRWGE